MYDNKKRWPLHAIVLAGILCLQACGGDDDNSPPPEDSPDTTPAGFSFVDEVNVATDSPIESGSVTISGINAPAPVTIAGGEYSIDDGPYTDSPGSINVGQQVRVRVQSSSEFNGMVTATLTIGGVTGTFSVTTADLSIRVEAESAALLGGAAIVTDDLASNGEAVLVGSDGFGISISESLEAEALIVAYRSASDETLAVTVNDVNAGNITLSPTSGVYATASIVVSASAGDVITMVNTTAASVSSETFVDYIEFADSPFRAVSTLVDTTHTTSDGTSVGPDGNIYVSGGPDAKNILRVTPSGEISEFASGFVSSANGSDFDSEGNLYAVDYWGNTVHKITPDGTMTTLASSLDGPAGVWVNTDGNVLVSLFGANGSGTGSTVLSISPDGVISTFASGGGLQDVIGIVGDGNGRIFATNWSSGQLYEITGGTVTLLAGTGGSINQICYSNGYIYAPSPGDALIRRVSLDGTVETLTGTSERQTVNGPISSADFERPNSCDLSADGTVLYVMDRDSGLLRKIDAGAP